MSLPASAAEYVLPHDLEAERIVLGSVLIDNHRFVDVKNTITSADFYLEPHRAIFRVMGGLHASGAPIEFKTLCDGLGESGVSDAGGAAYIVGLVDGVSKAANVSYYAGRVAQLARDRRLVLALRHAERAVLVDGSAGTHVEALKRAIDAAAPTEPDDDGNELFVTAAATCRTRADVKMLLAPYVAEGAILSIIAKIKLGKTSLVLDMLRHGRRATSWCGFEAPARPFRILYATEQAQASFAKQLQDAGLGHDEGVIVTYLSKWQGKPWAKVAPRLIAHALDNDAQVLVVDTASRWFGFKDDEENNSGGAQYVDLLLPYTEQGGTVILVRHARKSASAVEDAGRGSSAIEGAVDAILHLTAPSGQPADARQIDYRGRFDMPERVVVRRRNFEPSTPCVIGSVEVPSARYYFERADVIPAASTPARIRAELARQPQVAKELADALGVSVQTINREITGMSDVVVLRTNGGLKHNAKVYGLKAEGTLPSQSHRDGEVESWGKTA